MLIYILLYRFYSILSMYKHCYKDIYPILNINYKIIKKISIKYENIYTYIYIHIDNIL